MKRRRVRHRQPVIRQPDRAMRRSEKTSEASRIMNFPMN